MELKIKPSDVFKIELEKNLPNTKLFKGNKNIKKLIFDAIRFTVDTLYMKNIFIQTSTEELVNFTVNVVSSYYNNEILSKKVLYFLKEDKNELKEILNNIVEKRKNIEEIVSEGRNIFLRKNERDLFEGNEYGKKTFEEFIKYLESETRKNNISLSKKELENILTKNIDPRIIKNYQNLIPSLIHKEEEEILLTDIVEEDDETTILLTEEVKNIDEDPTVLMKIPDGNKKNGLDIEKLIKEWQKMAEESKEDIGYEVIEIKDNKIRQSKEILYKEGMEKFEKYMKEVYEKIKKDVKNARKKIVNMKNIDYKDISKIFEPTYNFIMSLRKNYLRLDEVELKIMNCVLDRTKKLLYRYKRILDKNSTSKNTYYFATAIGVLHSMIEDSYHSLKLKK